MLAQQGATLAIVALTDTRTSCGRHAAADWLSHWAELAETTPGGALYTASQAEDLLDAFERACMLLGYPTSRSVSPSTHRFGGEQHVLTVSERGTGYRPRRNTMTVRNYTGTVWCPTVADTNTMLMRRNGFISYTGNSAWAVDENEIKFGVQPVVAIICHALTVGLLRPLLVEQGVPDSDLYSVWYDTTLFLVRSDRSKDAQILHDRGVISDAVLRRENGFDESDAPDPDERMRTVVRDLIATRSDLIDKWLPALGITVPGVTDNPVRVDDTLSDAVLEQQDQAQSAPAAAPEADNGPPIAGETEASSR